MRYDIIVACFTLSAASLPIVNGFSSDTLTLTKYQLPLNPDGRRISQDRFKIAKQQNSYKIIDRQKRSSKIRKLIKNEPEPMKNGPITEDKSGNLHIRLKVKPGAKNTEFTDVSDDAIGIKLKAPAEEGKANSELINYLSDVMDVKKRNIELKRGKKSRNKTVVVSGFGGALEDCVKKILRFIRRQKKKHRI